MWLLWGLGGVGKSTVALAVAREARSRGTRCYWVNAADKSSIQATMWRMAAELSGPGSKLLGSPSQAGAVDSVWEVLENADSHWLLVIDNADDPQVLAADGQRTAAGNGWLRSARRGTVIVTSRANAQDAWGQAVIERRIEPLPPVTGGQVLRDFASGRAGNRHDAERLSAKLGGLPLALRLAGLYIRNSLSYSAHSTSFAQYEKLLESRFQEIIDAPTRQAASATGEDANRRELIMATWELSLDWLAEHGTPEARRYMQLMSCFGRAPAPLALLENGVRAMMPPQKEQAGQARWPDEAQSGDSVSARIHEVLHALRNLALLDSARLPEPAAQASHAKPGWRECITIHPLVAQATAANLTADAKSSRLTQEAVMVGLSETIRTIRDEVNHNFWRRLQLLEPHMRNVAEIAVRSPKQYRSRPLRAPTRALIGNYSSVASATTEVLETYVGLAFQVFGNSKTTRRLRHLLSLHLWSLDRYDAALAELRAAHNWVGRILWRLIPDYFAIATAACSGMAIKNPPDSAAYQVELARKTLSLLRRWPFRRKRVLESRWIMADPLAQHQEYTAAERELREMLDDTRTTLGDNNRITLHLRRSLATVLREQGQLDAAENELTIIIQAEQRILGEDHPDTISDRRSIATVFLKRGQLTEAEEKYRAIVNDQQSLLGEEHPSTLLTRHEVAAVLRTRRQLDAAETECRAVLKARRRVLGENHPSTLATRHNLATVLGERGQLGEAETEYRAVLNAQRRVLGENHPSTLTTRHSLAALLHVRRRFTGAETEYRAVHDARCRSIGSNHRDTLVARLGLAFVLGEQGQLDAAETEYRAVLNARRHTLGEGHPDTLTTRHNLATLLHTKGQLDTAETEFRAVLDARRRALGENNPDTVCSSCSSKM